MEQSNSNGHGSPAVGFLRPGDPVRVGGWRGRWEFVRAYDDGTVEVRRAGKASPRVVDPRVREVVDWDAELTWVQR